MREEPPSETTQWIREIATSNTIYREIFGLNLKRSRHLSAFEAEVATNTEAVLALLCRDVFNIFYAEPTCNNCFPELAGLERGSIPALAHMEPYKVRYLCARTCCPRDITEELRSLRETALSRNAFKTFADAIHAGRATEYKSVLRGLLTQCGQVFGWMPPPRRYGFAFA